MNRFPQSWGSPIGLEGIDAPGNPQNIPNLPTRLRSGRFQPAQGVGLPIAPIFNESDYVKLNGSQRFAIPNGSSLSVLPTPNQLRNWLGLRNDSATANVYVEFGNVAGPFSWIKLAAGQILLFDTRIPQDEVYAYADAADAFLVIVQSTTPGIPA